MDGKDNFPVRLTQLMKDTGTSQEKLGKALGSKRQTISLYANGKSIPDIETLDKIADYFGVTTDYLLGRGVRPALAKDDIAQIAVATGLSGSAVEWFSVRKKAWENAMLFHKKVIVYENNPPSFSQDTMLEVASLVISHPLFLDLLERINHVGQADLYASGDDSETFTVNDSKVELRGAFAGDWVTDSALSVMREIIKDLRKNKQLEKICQNTNAIRLIDVERYIGYFMRGELRVNENGELVTKNGKHATVDGSPYVLKAGDTHA